MQIRNATFFSFFCFARNRHERFCFHVFVSAEIQLIFYKSIQSICQEITKNAENFNQFK